MSLWLHERHTPGYGVYWKILETLHTEKTRYQELTVVETVDFGRALILDGNVQVTLKDEFIYHEMIAHVPLCIHPDPQKILVIGGGDGGTVREILKHSVKQVDLVEIDQRVVAVSQEFFPEISSALTDPRVTIIFEDGIKYVNQTQEKYDVVIIDSSDPIGPATGLFAKSFYQDVYACLKDDGLMVAQTESPTFNTEILTSVYTSLQSIFPLTKVYLTSVPSYLAGFWTFTMGSKKHNPLQPLEKEFPFNWDELHYYTPQVHQASFVLPSFVHDVLKAPLAI